MQKISTVQTSVKNVFEGQLTIGVDLGDRSSAYCILNEAGEIVLEHKLPSTPEAMKQVRSYAAVSHRSSFRDCKATAYLLMLGRVAPTILLLWQVLERPLVNQMHFCFGSDNIRRLLTEKAYKFLSLAFYRFEIFICAETDYCHRKLAIRARKQKRMNVSRGHRRPSEI